MAALMKTIQLSKTINNVAKLLTDLTLSTSSRIKSSPPCNFQRMNTMLACSFHVTSKRFDLMEFFDDKKNWDVEEVKCGRSWKIDELRIKSNEDLHKLWFVLLKERNMLITMEEACNDAWRVFPNPERIDKVADSMANLEAVVRERNTAYHMLETGVNGERPMQVVYNQLGLKMRYRMSQHSVPKYMNRRFRETHTFGFGGYAVAKFRRLYAEKLWNEKRKAVNRQHNRVRLLMRKFPNLDWEAVKKEYPDVNIEKVKRSRGSHGHYIAE